MSNTLASYFFFSPLVFMCKKCNGVKVGALTLAAIRVVITTPKMKKSSIKECEFVCTNALHHIWSVAFFFQFFFCLEIVEAK